MGCAKYKVRQGNFVLGNYPGKTADIALDKAIKQNMPFGNIDFSKPFDITRGRESYTIKRER